MHGEHEIKITTRDRLLRAWQNSTELVRDFENYARETGEDQKTADVFAQFAEDEGHHAAQLLEMLQQYEEG